MGRPGSLALRHYQSLALVFICQHSPKSQMQLPFLGSWSSYSRRWGHTSVGLGACQVGTLGQRWDHSAAFLKYMPGTSETTTANVGVSHRRSGIPKTGTAMQSKI